MKGILVTLSFLLLSIIVFAQQQNSDAALLELYQAQKFGEAADYLKQTYPEPVKELKTLKSLAYASQMAGRLADAEDYYSRILGQDSTNNGLLLSLGSINLRRGNNTRASEFYSRYVRLDTTNYIAYKQLAAICFNQGDIQGDIANLAHANRLNPADADIAADLSELYISLNATKPARKVLDRAIAADPDNLTLLESRVKLSYAEKDWPDVIASGERLVQMGNLSPLVLSKIGQAYYNLKGYRCGIAALTAIDKQAQNETTLYFTGACYKQLNQQAKAVEYFLKTIDAGISPNTDAYYSELADSYGKLGKNQKAVSAYKRALLFNVKPMTYYAIASLYDDVLKNKKAAIIYYRKYIAAKPPVKQHSYLIYAQARITKLQH